MGIGVADFDDDGWSDVFVANDTVPVVPVHEQPQRHASPSRPSSARVAFTDRGEPVAGMGVDARDVDNDGRPDVFLTALAAETFPLFRNLGGARLRGRDRARRAWARSPAPWTGWGNGIVDLNNDGWKDLFVACAGVIDPEGAFRRARAHGQRRARQPRERPLRRRQRARPARRSRARPCTAGAAFGDVDNDGRVDVVVTAVDGALELWRNVSPAPNHWLLVRTPWARRATATAWAPSSGSSPPAAPSTAT